MILSPGRPRQEDHEFEASIGYREKSLEKNKIKKKSV